MCRIFQILVAYFAATGKFHSDCGGEFANVFREMNEKLGIETSTTPGELPFNNGVVERNNKVLYEALMKNAFQNHGGHSPNQSVFGTNVNSPSVITDLVPASESYISSDIVRRN